MSAFAERNALLRTYSGAGWKERVKKMSDSQVVAIYLRLKSQGKLK